MSQNRAKFHFDRAYDWRSMRLGPYTLAQIGDLKCEPGYQIEPHQQWVDEISLVISGDAVFEADGKSYPVSKGTIFLSGRHEVHAIRSSKEDPMRMLYIGFDFTEPVSPTMAALKAFFDRPAVRVVCGTLNIQQAYMHLMTEIMCADELSPLLMEGLMHEIICSVYRLCQKRDTGDYLMKDAAGASEKLVHDVILYLETQEGYTGKLQNLSEEFGYSYAHIAKEFSALTGESLKAYHTRLRFAQARSDMLRGISVTDTAERMGYKSIHAFSKAFKKSEGVTASEFMRSVRSNQPGTGIVHAAAASVQEGK
ncbi:MAG: AraC family transcriptional regulator [Clostridia bacterium]